VDRSKFVAKETRDLVICYPNGAESDFVVKLRSLDSKEPRQILKKWDRIASKAKKGRLDFDQKEEASIELLASCIDDWKGLEEEGKAVECTQEEKVKLLKDKETRFVREQIDEAVGDVSSFLEMSDQPLKST
jgi:hypothetical protein